MPLRAEHLAVVQCEPGAVYNEVDQLLVAQFQGREVHPYQEGGLRLHHAHARDALGEERAGEADVLLDIREGFRQPRLAVGVGCFGADCGSESRSVELVGGEPVEERAAQLLVFDHAPGAYQSGDVERLGRRAESYGYGFRVLPGHREGDVGLSVEHQVAVDFVGNDRHARRAAYPAHFGEGLAAPLQSDRVVGVAENHHRRALRLDYPAQPFEVHLVAPFRGTAERVGGDNAAVPLDYHLERMVDRGLDHDSVPRAREEVYGEGYPLDHAGDVGQLPAPNFEAVAAAEPGGD